VTITDGFGRSWTLNSDGKKQERVTGEGEFSSKTHFEGAKLIVEDDFKGPKVITIFEPTLEGGEISRLIVTLTVEICSAAAAAADRRAASGTALRS
jgi:hypothetical protein